MAKLKFLKRVWNHYSKLGRRKKKKQVWRRPRGRDNKMREKRKGYPAVVSVGYINKKEERKKLFVVKTLKDLEKINEKTTAVFGRVGRKKKLEIAKKAEEKGITMHNDNLKKIIKKLEKSISKKQNKENKNEP